MNLAELEMMADRMKADRLPMPPDTGVGQALIVLEAGGSVRLALAAAGCSKQALGDALAGYLRARETIGAGGVTVAAEPVTVPEREWTPQEAVRALRGRTNWSDSRMAREAGVSVPMIARMADGRVPRWDVGAAVVALADAVFKADIRREGEAERVMMARVAAAKEVGKESW